MKAIANDIGPILPKYIVNIIIIFPILFKDTVKFLESPTVAVALAVSYNISTILLSIVKLNNIVDVIVNQKNREVVSHLPIFWIIVRIR